MIRSEVLFHFIPSLRSLQGAQRSPLGPVLPSRSRHKLVASDYRGTYSGASIGGKILASGASMPCIGLRSLSYARFPPDRPKTDR